MPHSCSPVIGTLTIREGGPAQEDLRVLEKGGEMQVDVYEHDTSTSEPMILKK